MKKEYKYKCDRVTSIITVKSLTHHIMKSNSSIPHLSIPFSHARNDNIFKFLDKDILENRPSTRKNIGQLDSIVNIGDYAYRGVGNRNNRYRREWLGR